MIQIRLDKVDVLKICCISASDQHRFISNLTDRLLQVFGSPFAFGLKPKRAHSGAVVFGLETNVTSMIDTCLSKCCQTQ